MPAVKRISTIIATHNRPQFLVEALDCLAAQRLPPTEVIVVVDGSAPVTRQAVARWRAQHSPAVALRYLYQDNSGPAVARNRGIEASRGDWLHFMDDDDLMAPEALQQLAAALDGAQGPALAMSCYALLHPGDDTAAAQRSLVRPCRHTPAQRLAAMIAGRWFVPIHGYLFTREAIMRMGPWAPALASQEDDEFPLRAALEAIDFVPAPVVYYRQHEGVRRATPGKPGESVHEGLRKRLCDDLEIREAAFRELQARQALEQYRTAFRQWRQRLVALRPAVERAGGGPLRGPGLAGARTPRGAGAGGPAPARAGDAGAAGRGRPAPGAPLAAAAERRRGAGPPGRGGARWNVA